MSTARESLLGSWFITTDSSAEGVINFFAGKASSGVTVDDDILFHMSFRPADPVSQILMNSCAGGVWGAEERIELPAGRPLYLQLVVDDGGFRILINGMDGIPRLKHLFRHRAPASTFTRAAVPDSWRISRAMPADFNENRIANNICAVC